jgi:3-phosphoshikimate 1-carboxyvinyltransferase
MLGSLGLPLVREENRITLFPYPELPGATWEVPGDFSSAAFWIVGAALVQDSELLLEKVGLNPTRTGLLEVLERMGLQLGVEDLHESGGEPRGNLRICSSSLESTRVTASEVPRMVDELPVLAVAATQAKGKTEIRGARELRYKECDRIRGMAEGLAALGADIQELEDGWVITGPTPLHGGKVKTLGDHRIAMALSIAALVADGGVELDDPECVNISYPSFFEDLEKFRVNP